MPEISDTSLAMLVPPAEQTEVKVPRLTPDAAALNCSTATALLLLMRVLLLMYRLMQG